MPQVHNRSVLQAEVGVRFLATMSLSGSSMKTVQIKNSVAGKLRDINVRLIEKMSLKSDRRELRMRQKLRDSLKRMVAYKKVVQCRTLAREENYKKSLELNYSEFGMRSEIRQILYDTDPETIRQRRAVAVVEENRRRYRDILQKNKEDMLKLKQRSTTRVGENTEIKTHLFNDLTLKATFRGRTDHARSNPRRQAYEGSSAVREIVGGQYATGVQPIAAIDMSHKKHKYSRARGDTANRRDREELANRATGYVPAGNALSQRWKGTQDHVESSSDVSKGTTESRAGLVLPPLNVKKYISTGLTSEVNVSPKRVHKLPPVKAMAI